MFRTALLLALLTSASAGFAQTTYTCPDTHYPCGQGSCCSK